MRTINEQLPSVGNTDRPDTRAARIFAIVMLLVVAGLLWLARDALGPFIVGILLIYILLPLVKWIERHLPEQGFIGRKRRPIAAIMGALFAVGVLAVLIGALIGPVIDDTREVLDNLQQNWEQAKAENKDFRTIYEDYVPEQLQTWIDSHTDDIGRAISSGAGAALSWIAWVTGSAISSIMAFVSIPLFVLYYMMDQKSTTTNLRRQFPKLWADDAIALFKIFDRVFGDYTRGVVIESVIVGFITGAAYWIIGVNLFLPLGVIAFMGEIVPIVGPWLAFIVSFPVILATQPDKAIWAMAVFLVIQVLEGWFLAPQILGQSSDFTRSGTIFLLAVGGAIGGGLGVVLALPVTALIRAVGVYIHHRLNGHDPETAMSMLNVFQREQKLSIVEEQTTVAELKPATVDL